MGTKTMITGDWKTRRVWIVPKELLPGASLRAWNHADSFSWGYGGSGPAQLALAILLEITKDARFSVGHHQAFKWDVIARLPKNSFILPLKDVTVWIINEARAKYADPS